MVQLASGKHFRGGITLFDLFRRFPNDAAAEAWFTGIRWPNGPICPNCEGNNIQSGCAHKTMPYRCRGCGKKFSVRTGTVMQASNLGYQAWAMAIYVLNTGLKGTSSMKLHRDLGITQKSAWHLAHRIRESWADRHETRFIGPVEADETFVGGRERNKHASRRLNAGRGTVGKTAVAGVRDRASGQVSAAVVPATDRATLVPFVAARTTPDAQVYTDDHGAYRHLPPRDRVVRHGVGQYVDGQAHTNGLESFWSLLKCGYHGTYHHLSEKHLDRYVSEFSARHNSRPLGARAFRTKADLRGAGTLTAATEPTAMGHANWTDKSIFTGDNLPVMRGMNSESVDLIYLDPPFNSNANYAAPIGSRAAGAAFKDTWTLSDIDVEWINLMEAKHPALWHVLMAGMTPSNKSYLVYMAARLLEMHRVLKQTGSIYLHCDPTMSHYLKLVLDAVFGARNFRTEIIWKRTAAHSDTKQGRQQHGRVHDVLLFYSKSDSWTWNPLYTAYDQAYIDRFYRHIEPGTGRRYQLTDITGPGGAAKGNPHYELMGVTRYWRYSRARMQELIEAGRIVQTRVGAVPRYKRYLDEMPGIPLQDLWADVRQIASRAKERTGYPTQKPLALLDRIIRASSNEGDIVLDPFCGCATACVAAELAGRNWVGIDISSKAAELVRERLQQQPPLGIGSLFHNRMVNHRTDIPFRNDLGFLPLYNCTTNRNALYGAQGGNCAGCGEHFLPQHLEVDHIISQSKGGTDHLDNLQLLCSHCNRVKGDRGMEYLRTKLQLAA